MNEDIKSLQACRSGDVRAFEAIVRRYQALVCAITYSAVGRRDVSEELAQETFVQVWKNLGQLKEPGKFRSWLCSIAHSIVCNHLRTQKRSPVVYGEIEDMPVDGQEQSPHEALVRQEEEEMIRTALMHIPDEYREPLVLFYRQDQSTRQVAELMGLPQATVRTRLHRGRQMLREQVESKIETTLKKTAPGAAFTRSVMGAVGVGLAAGIASSTAAGTLGTAAAAGGGTGLTAAMAAAMSTLTAKIVIAAAVVVIGIGGVIAYKSFKAHSDSQLPTEPIKQAVVLDKALLAVSIEKTTGDTVNQQLANDDNQAVSQPDTVQNKDAATSLSEPASKSDENETVPVDSDNQNTNILSLKVISKETGQAVTDADVKVRSYGGKDINSEGKTNSFGRYEIKHDLTKLASLSITVTSNGCVPMKIDFRDEAGNVKLPLNYILSLEKGTTIGGIIANEQNQPIQDVSVSLLVPSDRQAEQPTVRPDIWDYVVKTDVDGKWA
jgi:RNA polymerase sigma factor (sigma-70 family)